MYKIVLMGFISLMCYSSFAQVKKTVKPVVKKRPPTVVKKTPPSVVMMKRAPGGLMYQLFPASTPAPLAKVDQIVKFHYTITINDSTLYTTQGKLPGYVKIQPAKKPSYNLTDILPKMKKGDSAVTTQLIDTLMKQGLQVPPFAKKGDKLITRFRILQVFAEDSVAKADFLVENEKDMPRQMKEQAEQMAFQEQGRKAEQAQEDLQLEASGEIAREIKEIETYLAEKKIITQKAGKGTYVHIQQVGDGPAVDSGKYVTVEYVGKHFGTDSVFESSTYTFQLGRGAVIRGWDEGLKLFKKGGAGTLYVPGFMAYGPNPPQGSPFKPFAPLMFDVKIVEVKDEP
ncbi:MAG: FKBP-type peptidyl-prolyl cis-trans isomerase [Chitinophagaceae bacterium]|nr:FKBP-type peptidyl-prolyl cis-trans isomerase [Chitinophagaceae bacterium]